jgi:hypothetical protein
MGFEHCEAGRRAVPVGLIVPTLIFEHLFAFVVPHVGHHTSLPIAECAVYSVLTSTRSGGKTAVIVVPTPSALATTTSPP